MQPSTVSAVQAMLTPAVAISAVGLLLLTVSNRYSATISRVRLLNEERRRLRAAQHQQPTGGAANQGRLASVSQQTQALLARMRLLRNALFCLYLAIGLFVLTSVGIGAQVVAGWEVLRVAATAAFLGGMLAVLLAVSWATLDLRRSFRVVELDVQTDS